MRIGGCAFRSPPAPVCFRQLPARLKFDSRDKLRYSREFSTDVQSRFLCSAEQTVTEQRFIRDVLENLKVRTILERWGDFGLPDSWLVAGCLFQTVWNVLSGLE